MDKFVIKEISETPNSDGTISICFEVEEDLYKQLTEILAPQGLTPEKVIELFYCETARLGRLPFEYTEEDIAAIKGAIENHDICNV